MPSTFEDRYYSLLGNAATVRVALERRSSWCLCIGKFVGAREPLTRLARLQLAGLLSLVARNWAGYRAFCISSVIF